MEGGCFGAGVFPVGAFGAPENPRVLVSWHSAVLVWMLKGSWRLAPAARPLIILKLCTSARCKSWAAESPQRKRARADMLCFQNNKC